MNDPREAALRLHSRAVAAHRCSIIRLAGEPKDEQTGSKSIRYRSKRRLEANKSAERLPQPGRSNNHADIQSAYNLRM